MEFYDRGDLCPVEIAVWIVIEKVAVGVDIKVAAEELRAVRSEAFKGFDGDGEDRSRRGDYKGSSRSEFRILNSQNGWRWDHG
jgi:hypothetical protein